MSSNGTIYKVATTIVGVIIVSILIFMGTGIINNDQVRAREDQKLEDKIIAGDHEIDRKSEDRHCKILKKVECLEDNMNNNFRQLFVEVGKIQAKMD